MLVIDCVHTLYAMYSRLLFYVLFGCVFCRERSTSTASRTPKTPFSRPTPARTPVSRSSALASSPRKAGAGSPSHVPRRVSPVFPGFSEESHGKTSENRWLFAWFRRSATRCSPESQPFGATCMCCRSDARLFAPFGLQALKKAGQTQPIAMEIGRSASVNDISQAV